MGMIESFTKKYGHFAEGGSTAAEKRGMTSSMHMADGGGMKKMAEGQKIAPVTAYKKGGKSCKKMAEGGSPSFIPGK